MGKKRDSVVIPFAAEIAKLGALNCSPVNDDVR